MKLLNETVLTFHFVNQPMAIVSQVNTCPEI